MTLENPKKQRNLLWFEMAAHGGDRELSPGLASPSCKWNRQAPTVTMLDSEEKPTTVGA